MSDREWVECPLCGTRTLYMKPWSGRGYCNKCGQGCYDLYLEMKDKADDELWERVEREWKRRLEENP